MTKNLNGDPGISRDTSVGGKIEKSAPAHFENKEIHRNHIGTGSSRQAQEYRNWRDESDQRRKIRKCNSVKQN